MHMDVHGGADEMTWSSDAADGEEAEVRTEEGAVTAALRRAFRAVDEEVTGSVILSSDTSPCTSVVHCSQLLYAGRQVLFQHSTKAVDSYRTGRSRELLEEGGVRGGGGGEGGRGAESRP